MAEILATTDDINANLPSEDREGSGAVVIATDDNTALLQVSVARVIRGYLSSIADSATLMSWDSPEDTPDIVREAAALMIAADHYFNRTARTTANVEARHYAQILYDRAMEILNKIVDGSIIIISEVPVETIGLSILDFHPVDDTDRAFSMGMEL
jgi:hypothetical protein